VSVREVWRLRAGEGFLVPGRRERRHDATTSWHVSDARSNITGVLRTNVLAFWNIAKA
jgi:hypothetical protein